MRSNAMKKAQPAAARSVHTMIRMPAETRQKLETLASTEDRSVSKMAVICIEDSLKARGVGA